MQRITAIYPRATALRTLTARATTTTTLRAHRTAPSRDSTSPATPTNPGTQTIFGLARGTHWDTSHHTPYSLDDRARSLYSTQIYAGQVNPQQQQQQQVQQRRGMHSGNVTPGPATGAETGVRISAQMFGAEVKGNPTESEADVAADRSDLDPLPVELHHTIRLGPGDSGPNPTESEADVMADRGGSGMDPLWGVKRK